LIYHLGDVDPDSRERLDGFLHALKEAGVRRVNDIVYNLLPEKAGAAYSLDKIFQNSSEFTAVICADEYIATRVTARAAKFHRSVPKDLGVVSFQSIDSSGPFSGPASDFREMGITACRLLAQDSERTPQVRVSCVWREKKSFLSCD
jgi:LacI family transcriptional regulator